MLDGEEFDQDSKFVALLTLRQAAFGSLKFVELDRIFHRYLNGTQDSQDLLRADMVVPNVCIGAASLGSRGEPTRQDPPSQSAISIALSTNSRPFPPP